MRRFDSSQTCENGLGPSADIGRNGHLSFDLAKFRRRFPSPLPPSSLPARHCYQHSSFAFTIDRKFSKFFLLCGSRPVKCISCCIANARWLRPRHSCPLCLLAMSPSDRPTPASSLAASGEALRGCRLAVRRPLYAQVATRLHPGPTQVHLARSKRLCENRAQPVQCRDNQADEVQH